MIILANINMFNGILPIGTVAKLKDMERRVMIIGYGAKKEDQFWDYVVCPFPYGIMDVKKVMVCNKEDIELIFAIGYQDAETLRVDKEISEALEKEKQKFNI